LAHVEEEAEMELMEFVNSDTVDNAGYVTIGDRVYALVPFTEEEECTEGLHPPLVNPATADADFVPVIDQLPEFLQPVQNFVSTIGSEGASKELVEPHRPNNKKPPRKPLQLDKYDGSNIPYETFRAKLAICAEYNQWSEEDQLAHLQSSLTNAAAQCLWDVGVEKANHLSALLDLLQLRFGSDNQRERYRVELRTRHQKPGESLQAVYQDIRRLLTLAFPGPSTEATEIIGCDAFLDSLADQEIALKVRERGAKTLEEARNDAIRLQAYAAARTSNVEAQHKQPRYARGTTAQQESEPQSDKQLIWLTSQVNDLSQKLDRLIAATPSSPLPSTGTSNVQPLLAINCTPPRPATETTSKPSSSNMKRSGACFSCGETGHRARSCPNGDRVQHQAPTKSPPYAKGSHVNKREENVYLTISIGNFTAPCLVDTGCQLSLVPSKIVTGLPLRPAVKQVMAANGTTIEVDGAITTTVSLNGYDTTVDFLVTKDVSEVMLGMDFLGNKACSRDFATSTLWLEGHQLSLHAGPPGFRCRRVLAMETVIVPPRSRMIIPALAPLHRLDPSSSDALFESRQIRPGLLVARAVASGRATRLPLCLLNLTNEPQNINSEECIGTLEPLSSPAQIIEGKFDPATDGHPTSASSFVNPVSESAPEEAPSSRDQELKAAIDTMLEQTSPDLTADQREQVYATLWFRNTLSINDFDIGYTDLVSHRIDTGDHPPIRETLRQHLRAYQEEMDAQVDRMLQQGIIEPCNSPGPPTLYWSRRKTILCAVRSTIAG
jgi:hypothetical protein